MQKRPGKEQIYKLPSKTEFHRIQILVPPLFFEPFLLPAHPRLCFFFVFGFGGLFVFFFVVFGWGFWFWGFFWFFFCFFFLVFFWGS